MYTPGTLLYTINIYNFSKHKPILWSLITNKKKCLSPFSGQRRTKLKYLASNLLNFLSLHSFIKQYLSITDYTGSWGKHFQETHGTPLEHLYVLNDKLWVESDGDRVSPHNQTSHSNGSSQKRFIQNSALGGLSRRPSTKNVEEIIQKYT